MERGGRTLQFSSGDRLPTLNHQVVGADFDDLRVLWSYLAVAMVPRKSDVLFCFGSSHFGVARRAARLFESGVAPWVVVTGGDEGRIAPYPTEADAYARVLAEAGVPVERIVVERRAANTGENVAFGMRALADRGIGVRTAALVAWPTSVRRCVATFARQFPDVATTAHPAFEGFGPYAATPARAASAVLTELDRLRDYPHLGHITPQAIPGPVERAAARLAEADWFLARQL